MQLAILLVLILIACILASWLFGVIVALAITLAAAYGLWVVVGAAVTLAATIAFFLVYWIKLRFFSGSDASGRTEQAISEVNRTFREQEAVRIAAIEEQELIQESERKRIKKARETSCKSCGSAIAKHSMYCPECGKNPL